jgi:hypothetical protein
MKGRIFLGLVVMGFGASAWAQGTDPMRIRNVYYGGTGCPQGSVDTYISPDSQAMTLIFDQYVAEAGTGIPISSGRKFCNLTLDLIIPGGWQVSVFKVDYRGYVDLRAGTSAQVAASYYFSGSDARTNTRTTRAQFVGAVTGNYTKSDNIGIESLVWSPCNVERALNVKTEARVNGRNGLLTVDTIDGEFQQKYHLKWRRCR